MAWEVPEPQLSLAESLHYLLGADGDTVSDDPATLAAHAGDKWFAAHAPEAVVFARSAEDVSRVLKFCTERGVPVTARGAGYGYVGGCVPARGGVALSLMQMNCIKEINARDFVAVAQPGVITGELQAAARAKNLYYPPDPASLKNSTLGGNIATNAGGPKCLKYGVTRHYVLGLEVVLANGDIVRCGGRTHKNKTGFDLIGLFVGSEGMLGVVTEATLRLLPLPPARAALSCGFADIRAAAAAVQAIFASGWLPAALEIADRFTLEAARGFVGKANVPAGDAHLLVELDGRENSLRNEIEELRALLLGVGGLEPATALNADCERLWDLRRAFSESLKSTGLTKLNEDVVVPRGRLVDLIDFAADIQRRYGVPVACFGHAGDGNIHVNLMAGGYHERADVRENMDRALDELFNQIITWGGAITGEHGVGLAKRRWWPRALSAENRALHARLKAALDPRGILNPGKFLESDG
ncbi:MAG: FAD-binding protein [Verrucomicrobia bacterium]|nr:FAD-binding protein [Verrucomicrobiota bacterium]MBV9658492.1 FAD-binding protein [Verrucomicrobiota bacterium]